MKFLALTLDGCCCSAGFRLLFLLFALILLFCRVRLVVVSIFRHVGHMIFSDLLRLRRLLLFLRLRSVVMVVEWFWFEVGFVLLGRIVHFSI